MKFLITLLLGLAVNAGADTFILKDGARLEGEVTGEMDNTVLVKTKYGSLTINKADIAEQKPAEAPKPAGAPAISSAAPAAVSSAAPVAVSTSQPAAEPPPARLTFATVLPSTSTRQLVYYEDGVAIATETFGADGAAASAEGSIKDGTYTESYPDGKLKTVKTMLGGKASGTLKAFYPSGALQVEAYYLGGLKDGAFKYFAEDGKPLLEASYRGDKLNGWKREFGPDGARTSEVYYADDKPAEPPKPQAAPEPAKEPESLVTAKAMSLARGERFSFQLNGKYIGKLTLDKDWNVISQEGKVPDGAVKVYSSDGKLQKELVFGKGALKALRVYEEGGPLKAEYGYTEDKAAKK